MIITAKIGPTFGAELAASVVPRDGVVWTANSVSTAPPFDDVADGPALEKLVAAHDPTAQALAPTIIPVLDLYRRMTDAEYAAMQQGVATQSPRVQGIFARADTFRSDAPEWPLLVIMARKLYGDTRAADLLNLPPFNGEA